MDISHYIESQWLRRILLILLGLIIVYLSSFYLKKGVNKAISESDRKYRARKAINIFSYLLILVFIAFVFNDKLGNLGIAIGVTGAGIALALQEVILSFAGWLFIVFTGKVSVGQRIKIKEIKGDVIDISIMGTTLMELGDWISGDQYNGRMVSISNSYVFKEAIQNYSSEFPFLWDEVQIPIRHHSDHALAREIFEKVAVEICGDYAQRSVKKWTEMGNRFMVEKARVDPMISLVFDQNWITFTIRYVVDYKLRRTTKDKVFTRILEELDKHKDRIQIATSAMEVTIPQGDKSHD